jgi:CubicO group peptidase (beta-lactamase class C family)
MAPSRAILLAMMGAAFSCPAAPYPAVDDIRSLLANRVDEGRKTVGIVVGTVAPGGREIIPYGRMSLDRGDPVDGDTIFEIGSVTKVFTSLLLADMVERGEVRLDDAVVDFLPMNVRIPSRNHRQITLLDLSMQVSGLPRMPPDFKPLDVENPFADFDAGKLFAFLGGYSLPRDIGEKYEYSNLGAGVLGQALAMKSGLTYEQLLRKRILDPLGMRNTGVSLSTLSEEQKKRLAPGYDGTLLPAKNWDFNALQAAGGMYSTANDLLTFVAANLELTDTPLKAAMRRMRAIRRATGLPDLEIMMAWHVWKKNGAEIVWHNGVTGGYWAFAGFDPVSKIGAVVLSNTSFDNDAIGLHAINHNWPVEKLMPPKQRVEITLDPGILSGYVGEYRFSPNYSVRITLENGHLTVRDTRETGLELLPEQETEFFFRTIDARVSFVRDASGKTTALILHVNDEDSRGVKVK